MGREITNLPMLRQVIDIGIENRQCPAHRSVIQKGKGFTNGRDKAIEKDRFQKATWIGSPKRTQNTELTRVRWPLLLPFSLTAYYNQKMLHLGTGKFSGKFERSYE